LLGGKEPRRATSRNRLHGETRKGSLIEGSKTKRRGGEQRKKATGLFEHRKRTLSSTRNKSKKPRKKGIAEQKLEPHPGETGSTARKKRAPKGGTTRGKGACISTRAISHRQPKRPDRA